MSDAPLVIRFFPLLFLCSALLIGIVSGVGSSVVITDHMVVPTVVMPGEYALVSVTIMNAATTSMKTDSTLLSSVYPVTSSESADVHLVIESVFLDGRGDILVLEGNSAFTGALGPGQSVDLTFLIRAR
jgi:hypothetical protein